MSIRQEKFASLLQQELATLFTQYRSELFQNAFITISKVTPSPDLSHAKVYLSFLQAPDAPEQIKRIGLLQPQIRKLLAAKIRKQVRIIPELHFFLDDSLDYVFKMERVFDEIKKNEEKKSE